MLTIEKRVRPWNTQFLPDPAKALYLNLHTLSLHTAGYVTVNTVLLQLPGFAESLFFIFNVLLIVSLTVMRSHQSIYITLSHNQIKVRYSPQHRLYSRGKTTTGSITAQPPSAVRKRQNRPSLLRPKIRQNS